MGKVIAMYVEYNKYGKKRCYIKENRKQKVISDGIDVKKRKWRKQCAPQREKHSKVAHSQKNQKAQQKRKRKKGMSGECLKF